MPWSVIQKCPVRIKPYIYLRLKICVAGIQFVQSRDDLGDESFGPHYGCAPNTLPPNQFFDRTCRHRQADVNTGVQ